MLEQHDGPRLVVHVWVLEKLLSTRGERQEENVSKVPASDRRRTLGVAAGAAKRTSPWRVTFGKKT
jgi:hypothetical protein